jgi:tetratricopeptide (TPR) repeat protein
MNTSRAFCSILVFSMILGLLAVIPQQVFAQADKGKALYDAKKYVEAEGALKDALKAEPWDTTTRYYLGLALLEQEKFNDAFVEIKKTQDEQNKAAQWTKPPVPSEYQIRIALARIHLGLKQYDEAWKSLESARIEDSGSSEVYLYRGICCVQQKKSQEAIKELEKSISLDPQNAYAHYYAGIAYSDAGLADKAAGAMRTFLKLAPNAPEAAKAKSMIQ